MRKFAVALLATTTLGFFHGVSLSLRGSGRLDTRLDTPPISYRHHPVSRLAQGARVIDF
jgi:hypothetical protein